MRAENPNNSRNVAQFFVKNRQIAWVALFATLAWGVFGYMNMPKRKDPDIPVRIALAITPWPGISADKVEQLVTRKVEQAITGNSKVDRVESTTQDNISVVQVRLLDNIKNTQQEFQDIGQRLNQITDLPEGRCRASIGLSGLDARHSIALTHRRAGAGAAAADAAASRRHRKCHNSCSPRHRANT